MGTFRCGPRPLNHMGCAPRLWVIAATTAAILVGCTATPVPAQLKTGLDKIDHIVVIYAENRSFDNLYGLFPGANGIANATAAHHAGRQRR